jgi:biopolymer transport protein ExbD
MAKYKADDKEKLSLTPMIDVVFLLLIFFIVTINPTDILSAPSVARPKTDITPPPPDVELFKIYVEPDGYRIDSARFVGETGFESLRSHLKRVAKFDSTLSVQVVCMDNAKHAELVRLLDVCYAVGLEKLALMTM